MDYDTLLHSAFNEIEDVQDTRAQLNETLRREGMPEIEEFEFDGPEDINVKMSDGSVQWICFETSMDELLNLIRLVD